MALGLVVVVGVVVIAGSVDAIILVIVAVALGLTWSWRRLVQLLVWLPVAVSADQGCSGCVAMPLINAVVALACVALACGWLVAAFAACWHLLLLSPQRSVSVSAS